MYSTWMSETEVCILVTNGWNYNDDKGVTEVLCRVDNGYCELVVDLCEW